MKRNYKKGFTLAEILICLVILGFIATILITSLNIGGINKKASIANAMKYVRLVNEASIKIKGQDANCPTGNFIEKTPGEDGYELTFLSDSGDLVTDVNVIDIYSQHLKFDGRYEIKVTDQTGKVINNSLKGARISGTDVLIGFEVFQGIQQCPDYVDIETDQKIEAPEDSHCWGQLWIFTNGTSKNEFSEDGSYKFGLDKDGVFLQGELAAE